MTRHSLQLHGGDALHASLIRANPCRFADRYVVTSRCPVGEGAFGRVHRCVDELARTSRAVKRIPMPSDQHRQAILRGEVTMLATLDHPHIVRLIEYFVEREEVLLVMELLEGPSLGERMQEVGRFGERAAAQCLRHMLKALLCCHCQGIAHNDVSRDNFRFLTPDPDSSLKMLDFGLSGRSCEAQTFPAEAEHGHFAQESDVWRTGAVLFVMLSGSELFPACRPPRRPSEQLAGASDSARGPSRLDQLEASPDALGVLRGMLEPSASRRLAARDALMHPFITRSYVPPGRSAGCGGGTPAAEAPRGGAGGIPAALERFAAALRSFHGAARMRRLALLIAAHLQTSRSASMAAIHGLFRFVVRDGRRVDLGALRAAMALCGVDAPRDLALLFSSADMAGTGELDYIEFAAVAIIEEPHLYCRDLMLRSTFRFLDEADVGLIDDDAVRSLFDLPMCGGGEIVHEACGRAQMTFAAFREVMVPADWDERAAGETPAPWAERPDLLHWDSEVAPPPAAAAAAPPAAEAAAEVPGAAPAEAGGNPVKSLPSEAVEVCQPPGFHRHALRPFYASQPVSNVVLGIVRGTSRYAREAAERGLAEVLPLNDPRGGAFFIMPNPKYHWTPEDVEVSDSSRLRFVAWWIHPDFVHELSSWFDGCPRSPRGAPGAASEAGVGAPGDFGFSGVGKPGGYLHTYRDLAGRAHVDMLEALVAAVGAFLEHLLGGALSLARLSVGFHYPVRPQYSTLHLQVRVNAGDVCGGAERRGADLFQLLAQLRADPEALSRDDEALRYQATSNLRAALAAAAAAAGREGGEGRPQALLFG